MNIAVNIFDKFLNAITGVKVKQVKKEVVIVTTNPHKIGDIFIESWGWEQTNVDAYQVVKVNNASVILRSICLESVGSTGWASDDVVPVKDSFASEKTYTKRVGKDSYLKGIAHGILAKHVEGRKYHRSWYA